MNAAKWEKKLSLTDAQRDTTGGKVPYLRLTSGTTGQTNFQTWFRNDFFASASWNIGTVGKENNVEIATVSIDVTIGGQNQGRINFQISHGPNRYTNNNAPNTWLHWPDQVRLILEQTDYSNSTVTLERDANGHFSLTI